jgi:hypothetical protein
MPRKTIEIAVCIKEILGFDKKTPTKDIEKIIKSCIKRYCKPCWELHYCPYGRLVEEFPLLPTMLDEAKEHNNYLIECIKNKKLPTGEKLTKEGIKLFQEMIDEFDDNDYVTQKPPKYIMEMCCKIFGHICPVFSCGEIFTETKNIRNNSRTIPRDILIKVIRRDNQHCQICNEYVKESEIEIDHIIPISKGGETVINNLRVLCMKCNRKKTNSIEEIIDDNAINKFFKQ